MEKSEGLTVVDLLKSSHKNKSTIKIDMEKCGAFEDKDALVIATTDPIAIKYFKDAFTKMQGEFKVVWNSSDESIKTK